MARGYKRKSNGELLVSDGKEILADIEQSGDEMQLLAQKFIKSLSSANIPIIVNEKKSIGALSMAAKYDIDAVIIDDGFQHRQLYRDLDIVIIDKDTLENPYLLPKGRMREHFGNISRADLIWVPEELPTGKLLSFNKPIIRFKRKFGTPYFLFKAEHSDSIECILNLTGAIAVSGIAKPADFEKMLLDNNIKINSHLIFNDHHDYTEKDCEAIIEKCKMFGTMSIIITEKDSVKISKYTGKFEEASISCIVIPMEIIIIEGYELLHTELEKLF